MCSGQAWLIWGWKVHEIYASCFWEKLKGEGRGSEDSTSLQQDSGSYASVAPDNGGSRLGYLAGDAWCTFFVPVWAVAEVPVCSDSLSLSLPHLPLSLKSILILKEKNILKEKMWHCRSLFYC